MKEENTPSNNDYPVIKHKGLPSLLDSEYVDRTTFDQCYENLDFDLQQIITIFRDCFDKLRTEAITKINSLKNKISDNEYKYLKYYVSSLEAAYGNFQSCLKETLKRRGHSGLKFARRLIEESLRMTIFNNNKLSHSELMNKIDVGYHKTWFRNQDYIDEHQVFPEIISFMDFCSENGNHSNPNINMQNQGWIHSNFDKKDINNQVYTINRQMISVLAMYIKGYSFNKQSYLDNNSHKIVTTLWESLVNQLQSYELQKSMHKS